MSFDIDKIGDGTWFEFFNSEVQDDGIIKYFDPEPGSEMVKVKSPSSEFIRELLRKTRSVEYVAVLNPKSRSMEFAEKPLPQTKEQSKAWGAGFADEAISDWKITKPDGTPIPCNLENKLKMMSFAPFDRFVAKCIKAADEMIIVKKEIEEKN